MTTTMGMYFKQGTLVTIRGTIFWVKSAIFESQLTRQDQS